MAKKVRYYGPHAAMEFGLSLVARGEVITVEDDVVADGLTLGDWEIVSEPAFSYGAGSSGSSSSED